MTGSARIALIVSSAMQRARWTAHSSFRSRNSAPTERMMAPSFAGEVTRIRSLMDSSTTTVILQ